jgi:hypothetical protein
LHAQTGRSTCDVLLFGDGYKVAQMSKFHRNILIRAISTCVPMAMLLKEHELIVSIKPLLQILSVSTNQTDQTKLKRIEVTLEQCLQKVV